MFSQKKIVSSDNSQVRTKKIGFSKKVNRYGLEILINLLNKHEVCLYLSTAVLFRPTKYLSVSCTPNHHYNSVATLRFQHKWLGKTLKLEIYETTEEHKLTE